MERKMTKFTATIIAPGLDDRELVSNASLKDAVAAAVRFGARYDDNAVEALKQGRWPHAALRYGKHPDEYVWIEAEWTEAE
jgi:hypothetical protein